MTGKTHKQGGLLISIIGFAMLRHYNLLYSNISLFTQWLVMYPFCVWGSMASDLDHHWMSCPQKDYVSWIINKVLHITAPIQKGIEKAGGKKDLSYKVVKLLNASHRSWQTHSDLTLFIMIWLIYELINKKFSIFNELDIIILSIVLTGVALGIIAHLFLDILTPEGIWLIGFAIINRVLGKKILPEKLHIVPHMKFFATGQDWEKFIQKVLKIATWVSLVWFLITIFIPNWMSYIPFEFSF